MPDAVDTIRPLFIVNGIGTGHFTRRTCSRGGSSQQRSSLQESGCRTACLCHRDRTVIFAPIVGADGGKGIVRVHLDARTRIKVCFPFQRVHRFKSALYQRRCFIVEQDDIHQLRAVVKRMIADFSNVACNFHIGKLHTAGEPVCHAINSQTAFICDIGIPDFITEGFPRLIFGRSEIGDFADNGNIQTAGFAHFPDQAAFFHRFNRLCQAFAFFTVTAFSG